MKTSGRLFRNIAAICLSTILIAPRIHTPRSVVIEVRVESEVLTLSEGLESTRQSYGPAQTDEWD
ncbi:MAG: hypothetical protein J6L98_00435 [Bacteroidales bacterium]|nr:hypothetical protein [Bacteroidales bacterium]